MRFEASALRGLNPRKRNVAVRAVCKRLCANSCRCGEMADAQDLKSWDLKKSCGFKSRHRHRCQFDKNRTLDALCPTFRERLRHMTSRIMRNTALRESRCRAPAGLAGVLPKCTSTA